MSAPFLETPRLPDSISFWASGGPAYNTSIVVVNSGAEKRNVNWANSRASYNIAQAMMLPDAVSATQNMSIIIAFFRSVKGRGYGFRFKDFLDYDANTGGVGIVSDIVAATTTTGNGNGTPSLQLYKEYTSGAFNEARIIQKPVASSPVPAIYRNAVLQTAGVNYSLDTATGIVTLAADASSAATAITAGATTSVSLNTNPGTLIAGNKLYLSGFTGADAALVNGLAHTINSVSGAGPFTFILATNTSGKTITVGAGAGAKYPQAADVMTWTGQFDVPCRFDVDSLQAGQSGGPESGSSGVLVWQSVPIVEIRL